jgi:antitoxin PrlF
MSRTSRQLVSFSKVSVNGQTTIPRKVRERLKLKSGDTLRFRMMEDGIRLDNATEDGDLFDVFSEWTSEADERAYREL